MSVRRDACLLPPEPPDCNNGVIGPSEGCEDDDFDNNDGCDATCQVETGWNCDNSVPVSFCEPECGDDLLLGDEMCDDNNDMDGDGCSSTCEVETGWTCGFEHP